MASPQPAVWAGAAAVLLLVLYIVSSSTTPGDVSLDVAVPVEDGSNRRRPEPGHGAGGNPQAILDTSMGRISVELFLDRTPRTVSNFIDLANDGFYNGLHFHRVIPNFMDQFGCPYSKDPHSSRSGTGGPKDGTFRNLVTGATEIRSHGGNIQDENIDKTSNAPGTLSMANTGQPNSGGSQFFVNVADNSNLNWFSGGRSKHPVFGKIVDGYETAVAISKVKTSRDAPDTPVKMNGITIVGI